MQRGVHDLSTAEYFSLLSFKWDGAPRTEMEFDRHTRTSPPLSIHYTQEHALSEQPALAFPLNLNWCCVVETKEEGEANGRRNNVEIDGIEGKNVTHFPLDFLSYKSYTELYGIFAKRVKSASLKKMMA